jgi:hypothetical protein
MTDEEKNAKEERAIQRVNDDIEAIVRECNIMAIRKQPPLLQSINMARGLQRLRDALPEGPVKTYFMPLKGTPLGFLTDEGDKVPDYSWQVVRDCIIEALLRGFRPIGNEFNIISGRFYGAKNGLERIVREYPGLSNLTYELGVPALGQNGALVGFDAKWTLDGEVMELCGRAAEGLALDTRIPVRVNSGMGPDAILGKATRKMFARIYNRILGMAAIDADGEPGRSGPDGEFNVPVRELPSVATPAQDGQRLKPAAAKNGTKPADEAPEPGSNG